MQRKENEVKIKIIENTLYGLLISMLILKRKKESVIEYIFPSDFDKRILKKLPHKSYNISNYGSIKNGLYSHYKSLFLNNIKKEEDIIVYGNDHLDIAIPYRKYPFYLIEDGILNYTYHKNGYKKRTIKEKIKRLIKLLPSDKKCYGKHSNIKKIYLTGLAPIPKEIAHKVEIINLKELWDKKSLEEQNEILDIFSFDLNIKEIIKDRDIILFTQPLSEDGVITEEEKIEIYSKIVKKYPQDRLIVKTHPREKTNYKEIFKDNLVLDNPFPFEILNLLDVKFNKAVTIFSTAALGLGKDVAVDFYGTEVNDKILARFGSCDNIMKRNSYLEEEE